jgi:hypothetical protein
MPDICSRCGEEVEQLFEHPYKPDELVCLDCRWCLIANFEEPNDPLRERQLQ